MLEILGIALLLLEALHGGLAVLEDAFPAALLIGEMGVCGFAAAFVFANGGTGGVGAGGCERGCG